MTAISIYFGLNVEIYANGRRQGWTKPLVNLTPLFDRYYRTRQTTRAAVGILATAAIVGSILVAALKFGLVGS